MIALSRQSAAVGGLCLFLMAIAAWQILAPVALDLPVLPDYGHETEAKSAPALPSMKNAGPADYSEVEKRPLFVAGRKPPAPPPSPKAVAQSQTLSAYSIIGIIAAPERAVAILHGPSGPPLHLRKGQVLEGWTLETIGPNRLTFVSGDERQELDLKSNKNQQGQGAHRTNMGKPTQRSGGIPGYPGVSAQ
jgi:hypothetical protein